MNGSLLRGRLQVRILPGSPFSQIVDFPALKSWACGCVSRFWVCVSRFMRPPQEV